MKPIQMVDLYSQYLRIKGEIDEAMEQVIRSSVFVKGGKVAEFETKLGGYLESEVISCGNGTDALHLAIMALGLSPGDEVITTPFTFVATVETLALLGLRPVFADVEPGTFNISVSGIEAAITPKTRAIVPVHLFGQSADMEGILQLAEKYGLFVVEDAAQSLGTDYLFISGERQKSGTLGNIGTTSFFPTKNIGAFGDGGAVITQNHDLAKSVRSLANHGMAGKYHYERVGVNSRLDALQAAILEVKLKYIGEYINARQRVAEWYDGHLAGIDRLELPERVPYSTHSFHQYTIRSEKRDALQELLKKRGIPSMVYYPKVLHLQEAYRFLGYRKGDFPVSEQLSETVLSLPMHTELDEEQLKYIVQSVKEFFEAFH